MWEGIANLDPVTQRAVLVKLQRQGIEPGEVPQVTIPGLGQIFQLGPRVPVTRAEWGEYRGAHRENRAPNLSPALIDAIEERLATIEAMRLDPTPAYMKGSGQILTALDNVQDLVATIAALGRFGLYLMPRILGRFVPGIGWVLIAADLLNLLGFLGMVATPLYALLCGGPSQALAAGVPGAVFKRALKQEAWRKMLANPFSRRGSLRLRPATRIVAGVTRTLGTGALLAERSRLLGRLPGISNYIEAAQVTQSLWGYGISLGAVVGMFFQAMFALNRNIHGEPAQINPGPLIRSLEKLYQGPLSTLSPVQRSALEQSAGVVAGAPVVQQVNDALPDSAHLLMLQALAGAIPHLREFAERADWWPLFVEAFEGDWAPVIGLDPITREMLEYLGHPSPAVEGHAVPGNPLTLRGAEFVDLLAPRVISATTRFLEERRNSPEGETVGTLINQTCEQMWFFLGGGDDAIAWQLTTDARLTASLCEEGYLVNVREPEAAIWRFWLAARAALEAKGATRLDGATWLQLAQGEGLTLIKLLPPASPWPREWDAFLATEHPPAVIVQD